MTQPLERLTAALADRYRIGRELGAGGMATVYLALDLRHQRKVALTVAPDDQSWYFARDMSRGEGQFVEVENLFTEPKAKVKR